MYFRVFGQNMTKLHREILAEDNAKKIRDATENEVKAFLGLTVYYRYSFRICSESGPIVGRDKKGQANQVVWSDARS
jgi:hypothetical protein